MRRELEVILNSTHDGMIAVDKKGIITLFNKAAERLTGIKANYALGKPVKEVIINTRLMYILETGDFELNRQQDLGNIKIITNRMPVKDKDGNIIGAVAVFRDITDVIELAEEITNLKEVQSLLEAIFHATQDAISVVDCKGMGVLVNPAYVKLTGLREKDVIGKPATVDIAEGESIHMKVLETKKPVKNARLKVGPNRKEVIAEAAPIMVDGELRGSVGVLHDVSEIIKLTNELKEAKEIIRKLEAKYTFDDIVGNNELIRSAIERAKKAAETPATVILRGESGTGKELFAHAIHNASDRRFGQFVRVNCAALSESLLESELFGYEEGAFTGAKKGGKKGYFEQANNGTIFLDEIGEISISTQVKLLRVLQEREIVRVGGTKPISINVRIIAATNMDLEQAVKEGKFREDLYYRLNVVPINIPPLRKRKDDIYYLTLNFIKKFNQEYGRSVIDISDIALERLRQHDWPGNVRELENVIGRSIINMKHNENIIQEKHLPQIEPFTSQNTPNNDIDKKQVENITLDEYISKAEKRFIEDALNKYGYNKTMTAKALGISIRSLYYKMDKYKIRK
ncbi:sigma-54 interaction domain-containing protein [Caldisalinibacter kiritimatiensis]|uniref:Transcriptional regulator BkdR of isoleucine and valine catabolism operon n=1 Tax=Caldisalinibacter kiritimatiensis TaxID=1304284 RepID=R1AR59_9FIRM|nr:sigma-54-dependent Fis family transcriptional regulator [Caldisalinibacter kiritimatiensis]EOC99642.1 Transcriptional regulator BkdR of isoleucine and valine catabolism operon [Caldisalinibacter kiritimatiensis]